MTKRDRAALELAMQHARRDPDVAAQLDSKLRGMKLEDGRRWACPPEPWREVAEFAAWHCQIESLSLMPWELPPCASDGVGDEKHAKLYRQLTTAGVSVFHPDPVAALEAAAEGSGHD